MLINATQKRPNKFTKGTIGVYCIRNIVTGQCYVGSSLWIEDRFKEHRRAIETKSSRHPRLREASEVYGIDDFEFEILQTFSHPHDLIKAENRWIGKLDSHRAGYNHNPRASRRPLLDRPESHTHQLRLPCDLVARIDAVRPKGITAPSRHDWFLQAMMEKLEREEGQGW